MGEYFAKEIVQKKEKKKPDETKNAWSLFFLAPTTTACKFALLTHSA